MGGEKLSLIQTQNSFGMIMKCHVPDGSFPTIPFPASRGENNHWSCFSLNRKVFFWSYFSNFIFLRFNANSSFSI